MNYMVAIIINIIYYYFTLRKFNTPSLFPSSATKIQFNNSLPPLPSSINLFVVLQIVTYYTVFLSFLFCCFPNFIHFFCPNILIGPLNH
ncbi:hypothetical protein L1887_17146 [Cichorium endivia]|nr:hypothetical protein L1887_17146 [Cichorium endivia]